MKRIRILFFLMVAILQGCNADHEDQKVQKEKKQVQKQKEEKTEEVKYTREELRQEIEKLSREYGLPSVEKTNEGSNSPEELGKNIVELADEYNRSSNDSLAKKEPSVQPNEFTEKFRELAERYNVDWYESPKQEKESSQPAEQSPNHEEPRKNQSPEKNVQEKPQPNPFTRDNTSPPKTIEKKANQAERGNHEHEHQAERIVRGGDSEKKPEEPIDLKPTMPKATDPQPDKQPTAMEEESNLAEFEKKDENLVDNIYNIATKAKERSDEIKENEKDFNFLDLHEEPGMGLDRRNNTPLTYTQLKRKYPHSFFARGEQGKERITLTFDDGPDLTYTPQILDILRESGVKATFFLIGERAEAHPDMVKQIIREGHEVGMHSYQHLYLPKLNETSFEQQIQRMEGILHSLGADTQLFRPPFGSINERQAEFMIKKRYKIVHWDVDSEDWKGGLDKKEIEDNVLGLVQPGSIILCHSASGNGIELSGTVEALPEIIEQLKKKDMTFVKVSDLLK